ncbi:Acyl-CoA dehydrogenase FadE27 (plasmid) [Caballeronia sp. SBC1]|uniref:acyl-CoA dehydrogenase family protein n=1 Tax=unclassified Caballeronia TaxID=2646786 RepID=UPI0013E13EAC|nr:MULTISPECIES: acyl-CoA dehydrogenase family protein [unclassified Caballeronia]QIE26821.1 Acyl-CoA dehydrogenase FadE27 [Caballeronia sp. SBC2]QIN63863.1 Acyl-CoA dehydrogenase FadE27 [Caballeronia sp. SBC1]
MNLALSEEQTMIRDAAAEVLAERSASAAVRHAIEHTAGRDEVLWRTLGGELGWCGLGVPEAAGGAGLGALELVLLMEQMGRRLVCVPYFSTVCLAGAALAQCESGQADARLTRIAEGKVSATLALHATVRFELRSHLSDAVPVLAVQTANGYVLSGTLDQVFDGATADLLIVPARIANGAQAEAQAVALFEIDVTSTGLIRTPLVTLDATRPLARVELHAVEAPWSAVLATGRKAELLLSRTAWFAALALAAEQLGGAQHCLDLTLAYAAERVQFGRTIASFQAVKHRCAQMMVEIEATRSAVFGAARAWDDSGCSTGTVPRDVLADIATAKATANDTFRFCAQEAIQLHGGVGFTWEYDPQLYFKRAQASSAQFGSTSQLLSMLAEQVIDRTAPRADASMLEGAAR